MVTFTDGDTTTFKVAGTNFVVRYLGIDSPEATSKYDPWGIAAGTFVRENFLMLIQLFFKQILTRPLEQIV